MHPNMDSWSSFIAGAEWQSHHNHASFVALVEGIEKLIVMQEKSAVRYKACFGDKNPGGEQIYEYFALQLKNLLNKIK